jgi:hypothetical protein
MSEEADMVKFINRLTGTAMWVADERVAEYEAAGHRKAVSEARTTLPKAEPRQEPKQEPKKFPAKKKK